MTESLRSLSSGASLSRLSTRHSGERHRPSSRRQRIDVPVTMCTGMRRRGMRRRGRTTRRAWALTRESSIEKSSSGLRARCSSVNRRREPCSSSSSSSSSSLTTAGAPDYKQDYAVNAYQTFKAYYNLQSDHAPPLVVIDLAADGTSPFALHPMLADLANSIPY